MQVISTIKRGGTLQLLVVLPNGSRSLIPASWTDWRVAERSGTPLTVTGPENHESCLASLSELLRTRMVVDALLGRCPS